jgi:hypothetical protein
MCPLNGDRSDGLSTIVQPVARAGNTFTAIWFRGQFHGVIMPQTPIGSLTTSVPPRRSSKAKVSRVSIALARWPSPRPTWKPLASAAGAPISSVSASARSPERFWYAAMMLWSSSTRSLTLVRDQAAKAPRAAATARSTSAAEPIAIVPQTSSVAGLTMSRVRSSAGAIHWPPI